MRGVQPRVAYLLRMSKTSVGSLFGLVAVVLLGPACERLDASHCWNRQRDATCEARGDALAWCSPCTAQFDGCVQTLPDPAQCPALGDGPGTGTTDASASTSTTAMTGGASSGSDDTSAATGSGETTAAMGSSESGDVPPEMMCGNGLLEGNEVCDGADFGGRTCAEFGGNGTLSCNSDCTLNATMCGGPGTCGDGEIDTGEECDGDNLGGMSCADVADGFPGGELSCSDCTFNTTPCCKENGALCSGNGQCCSGNCLLTLCAN